jgi:hypothetical protein
VIDHLILIFGFKSGKNFTPFLLLPDDQGFCLLKIVQAGIFSGSVSAVGAPVSLFFVQKPADNDAASRTLFE